MRKVDPDTAVRTEFLGPLGFVVVWTGGGALMQYEADDFTVRLTAAVCASFGVVFAWKSIWRRTSRSTR
jgi:hypothetical protein